MTISINKRIQLFLFFLISLLFFAQNLSIHGLEYRDDEIFYYHSAQEMMASHQYLSPTYFGENRFQKPILFYWLIILSYHIFGISWFAARFVSSIAAAIVVCLTWAMANRLFQRKVADISILVLMTIPLFYRHAKDAVPDMTLNLFIVLAFYCALRFFDNSSSQFFRYGFFVSCAFGFMTKGFAALIIPFVAIIIYGVVAGKKEELKALRFPQGMLLFFIIVVPWFVYMTLTHGRAYVDYVLRAETLNRAIAPHGEGNIVLKEVVTFKNNFLFYLKTLMSYFAPWSVFFIGAVPLVISRWYKEGASFRLVIIWFLVTFLFFSMIFTRINHLILVLTTPFAILVGFLLTYTFDHHYRWSCFAAGFRTFFEVLFLSLGFLAILFLRVFLLGEGKIWIAIIGLMWLLAIIGIKKAGQRPWVAAFILGISMLWVYTQSGLLARTRLTTPAALQSFGEVIQSQASKGDAIGVASHDIHEKELQVYVTPYAQKIATSDRQETKRRLEDFLNKPQREFCVMTKRDFETLFPQKWRPVVRIIGKEKIFRRRISLDKGFLKALLRLDTKKISNYFLEDIILVVKPSLPPLAPAVGP